MQKLYCYIDESGQDTKGILFVVSILVLEQERAILLKDLEEIERKSKKRNVKWHKARPQFRREYIELLSSCKELREKIFFEVFHDSQKYIELTSYATAKAILKKAKKEYKVTVYVDGLKRREIDVFRHGLRALRIHTRKVRGVKKDENDAFIRLVDAICGLVRDATDGQSWAKDILEKMRGREMIAEL